MENRKINWKRFWVVTRNVLNISWKVALVVIGIFAAFTVFEYIGFQYSEFFGRR